MEQLKFEALAEHFLDSMVENSRRVIHDVLNTAELPLIVNFSGGKDSYTLAHLVSQVTGDFVLAYMSTGTELPGTGRYVKAAADRLGMELIVSYPEDHLGDFFHRLYGVRRSFPTVRTTWCNADLKVRPLHKRLQRRYGKGRKFWHLVAVRRFESNRRRTIYTSDGFIKIDGSVSNTMLVFPIVNWTNDDVALYLRRHNLKVSSDYRHFGVSGCAWCPFYQPDIYRRILREYPDIYDRFIEAEETYGPSVNGQLYLRDIKMEVMSEHRGASGS